MTRAEIVSVFERMADIMQIRGDEPRRYQMYRWIARTLDTLREDIHVLYEQGKLANVRGIGASTTEKIGEIINTGTCEFYEELKASVPAGVIDLLSISGVGPATAARLYQELSIDSLEALQQALDAQELRNLKGMGKKTEENIRAGLEAVFRYRQHELMGDLLPVALGALELLSGSEGITEMSLVNGLRRRTETVGNIQILAACENYKEIHALLADMDWIEAINDDWTDSGGSVILAGDVELQVKLTSSEDFGSALVYFTGSESHVAQLNELAEQLGMNPIEPGTSAAWASGRSEEEIYDALGLPFIAPELREGAGEIQAALAGQLPCLIDLADIRGDLHVHSTWSDGSETIETMAEAAREFGYEYIGLCDHSVSSKIANGLDVERILNKMIEVREINERIPGIEILMGSEVDILKDGNLDYPEEILEKLDIVIASIHSGFGMDEVTMTERIISAIENKFVHMIGHPTGRLLSRREPYQVNIGSLIDAAADNNTSLEINAYPDRLDLKDIHARQAKERGVMMAICTDAHDTDDLDLMIYGIYTARRGWLEKKDVLNVLPLKELMNWLHNR